MSKEKILESIKKSMLNVPNDKEFTSTYSNKITDELKKITPATHEELMLQFKQEIENISGEFFHYCNMEGIAEIISRIMDEQQYNSILYTNGKLCQQICQVLEELNDEINIMDFTNLTTSEKRKAAAEVPIALVQGSYAVADIGAIVSTLKESKTTLPHFLAETLVIVIPSAKICANLYELFAIIKKQGLDDLVIIAGPSRTADIEQVLILGAHGPKRLVVIFLTDPATA